MARKFTGPVSSSCCFQSVHRGPGLLFFSNLLLSEKSPQTNFPGGSIHGSFLCGFSCLLAQGLSPRVRGAVSGQGPLPQLTKLNRGRCLCSDSVFPAPTSILFAGPLGPERAGGGGPKGKQLLPSLPASGDHHTPSLEACVGGFFPSFAPLPRNGGGAGQGQIDEGGGSDCSGLFSPSPARYIAGWFLRQKSVELGVWFSFGFWILKVHSFWRLCSRFPNHPFLRELRGEKVGQEEGLPGRGSGEQHEHPPSPGFLRTPSLGRVGDHQAFSTGF